MPALGWSVGLLTASARGAAGLKLGGAAPQASASAPADAAASYTYTTRAHERLAGREAAHLGAYDAVLKALGSHRTMFHSESILDYVRDKDYAPSLLKGGCLYLPSNEAWNAFYEYIEHPYPPLFAEMVARSFFPECNAAKGAAVETRESTRGLDSGLQCEDEHIVGAHGCVEAHHAGEIVHEGSTIQLFETTGHVALPPKWKEHIDLVKQSGQTRRKMVGPNDLPMDKCSHSWKLPEVPEHKKLVVPLQMIVCHSKPFHPGIDREMLIDQARWMNIAYGGRSTYSPLESEKEEIPMVDMQIEFDLFKANCTPTPADDCARITFAKDKACAERAFVSGETVGKHNRNPFDLFTVVFVGDDQSGILGMAEFPQLTLEGQRELVVRVSTTGLRHFSSKNTELKLDTGYDEGDTVVHEAGHSLGLFHTFQGGCALDGDHIADTHPEAFPTYKCKQGNSCGKTDPIHNFMDYPEDTCMDGFTELQKRRVWCVFENYRPSLFQQSLRIMDAVSPLKDARTEEQDVSTNHPRVTVDVTRD